jgi:phenylpyruvate tautomerase PptA (4-oxalocrotonate tautomerase family)
MPLIQVFSSVALPPDRVAPLLRKLSSTLAAHLQKPERYVMTRLAPAAPMTFGGSDGPACYAEVKNIGSMTPEQTSKLSAAITTELSAALGVPADRTYIEFCDAKPHLWGYDGSTFD